MTSIEMRNNPLFMRNSFDNVGKWDIPFVKKQNIEISDIRLVAYSDTRSNDTERNTKAGVHFYVDDFRFSGIYEHPDKSILELDYHNEKGLSKYGESVLHIHEYSRPGIENRLPARKATTAEIQKFRRYLKGVLS